MKEDYSRFISHAKDPWFGIPADVWNNYAWQLKHRITSLHALESVLPLTREERAGVLLAARDKLAMAITPYFFTLIDKENPDCPLRRQVIPRVEESCTAEDEFADPCGEEKDCVVPGLVHRYPDRVLFLVTDRCASYCRYCTRSRIVSGAGEQHLIPQWQAAFDYLEKHTEVRDVLLSGGDPLLLSDDRLDALLTRLRQIPHIEIVRIGSRTPIFLPQRFTPELCAMLRRHAPLYLSVHVNHPNELTVESKEALDRLVDHGIVMGSQSVLLRGVNDSAEIQMALAHKLMRCRVRPYYLYQCDLIRGSAHFRTSIEEGLSIMDELRGFTTGYAIPLYVVDGPGGGGKIPLNPTYILNAEGNAYELRNYKGDHFSYPRSAPPTPEKLEELMELAEGKIPDPTAQDVEEAEGSQKLTKQVV